MARGNSVYGKSVGSQLDTTLFPSPNSIITEIGKMKMYDFLCIILVITLLTYLLLMEVRSALTKETHSNDLITYDYSHEYETMYPYPMPTQSPRARSPKSILKKPKSVSFVGRFTRSGRMYGLHKLVS